MIAAVGIALAAALLAGGVHWLVARLTAGRPPERALLVASTTIVFGAVFGAIYADTEFGLHWGGAFIGGAVAFVVALIVTGVGRR